MGLYRDHILPRGINLALGTRECARLRERVARGLSGTVLEIGFGSGLNLPYLRPCVDKLLAIDPAAVGRRLAARRLRECAVPVEFIGLTGEAVPLSDACVDHVLSTWTLCTIPDTSKALSEIRRVLRPSGRLHFLEHGLSPEPRVAKWQHRLNAVQQRVAGGCRLNLAIADVIEAAGFRIHALDNFYMKGPRFSAYMYQGNAVSP